MYFEIIGNDLKKLEEFQKKHEQCIFGNPNISCAQYEYSFIPDGSGALIRYTDEASSTAFILLSTTI